MSALYAIAVIVGLVLLITWAGLVVLGNSVAGWDSLNPEARFGGRGRMAIAALAGFGMGGLSATFAGWATALALLAAVVGAAAMGYVARHLGPTGSS